MISKVYIYGAAALAIAFTSSLAGYSVGTWRQAASDAAEVKAATDALAQNARNVATAEKAVREAVTTEYEAELKAVKERAQLAEELHSDFVKVNQQLTAKLYNANQVIKELRNDPRTQTLLDTPLPAELRDRVRDALGAGVPGSPDRHPD